MDLDSGDEITLSDTASLQATGEYLVTSDAFAQYKHLLRQFVHPELKQEPRTQEGDVTDPGHTRLEDPQVSITLIEKGQCAEVDNVLDIKECLEVTSELSECRGQNLDPRQCQTSQTDTGDSSQEMVSIIAWLKARIIDAFWPAANGSRRIWYQCVSYCLSIRTTWKTDIVI